MPKQIGLLFLFISILLLALLVAIGGSNISGQAVLENKQTLVDYLSALIISISMLALFIGMILIIHSKSK